MMMVIRVIIMMTMMMIEINKAGAIEVEEEYGKIEGGGEDDAMVTMIVDHDDGLW